MPRYCLSNASGSGDGRRSALRSAAMTYLPLPRSRSPRRLLRWPTAAPYRHRHCFPKLSPGGGCAGNPHLGRRLGFAGQAGTCARDSARRLADSGAIPARSVRSWVNCSTRRNIGSFGRDRRILRIARCLRSGGHHCCGFHRLGSGGPLHRRVLLQKARLLRSRRSRWSACNRRGRTSSKWT